MLAFFALPASFKIVHAVFEHHNFVCKEKGKLHIHEVELECEFDKFNISHFIFPEYLGVNDTNWTIKTVKILNFYQFLSKYQKLHFFLRGPPTLL
ncbi:hypothetical protein KCTC52924_03127 [Arenibacter antarcticus]|nr:hypothetical protein [Arenibacter sp. H213]